MTRIKIFLYSLISTLVVANIFNTGVVYANEKHTFIDELIDEGDYFRAMSYLKESEFRFRGTEAGLNFSKKSLKLLVLAKDYDEILNQLDKIQLRYSKFIKNDNFDRMRGETAFLYGNYLQSYQFLQKSTADDAVIKKMSKLAAFPDTSSVDVTSCDDPVACKKLYELSQDFRNDAYKNQNLALGLGIVPGLGQIYAGSTWGGITSFVVNALLVGATIYGANNGEKAFAVTTGVIGAGFYFGSIYAGYETAKRYNEMKVTRFRNSIREVNVNLDLLKFSL